MIGRIFMVLVSLVVLAGSVGLVVRPVLPYFGQEANLEINGANRVLHRVFYQEDSAFFMNPVSPALEYLLVYVDHIEIDNRFYARLSDAAHVVYSYTAAVRFIIRHGTGAVAGVPRGVYERIITLNEREGAVFADLLDFPAETYRIDVEYFIRIYEQFVNEHRAQTAGRFFEPVGMRGFSAELFVDFVYHIRVPGANIDRSFTNGVRIPVSDGVFTVGMTGLPGIHVSTPLTDPLSQLGAHYIVLAVLTFGLGCCGFFYNIKRLTLDKNPKRREVKGILKKYSNEIVVSQNPFDKEGFPFIHVNDFDELLKLSVNLNKHIICYRDEDWAEFLTIVDGYLYYYPVYGLRAQKKGAKPKDPRDEKIERMVNLHNELEAEIAAIRAHPVPKQDLI